LPEQITSRVTARKRSKYFRITTAWARTIDDRGKLEQVARQHHHVEIGRDLEHPIELRQRIMQICYRKEAHRSPVLKLRNSRNWL
jgi:hypothetical protein